MNFNSPEWHEVCKEIEKRLGALDKMNRAVVPESVTSHTRGQIAALNSLRMWQETSALPEVQEQTFR